MRWILDQSVNIASDILTLVGAQSRKEDLLLVESPQYRVCVTSFGSSTGSVQLVGRP
jgi:hypothetical protein